MKRPFPSHILPLITLTAGIAGLVLRLWLFSAVDEKGLLPTGHPAGTLLFVLSAVVLGILFLFTRQLTPRTISKKLLRPVNGAACLLGCAGLVFHALTGIRDSKLAMPALILSLLGALALVCMAALEFRGKRVPYWLSAVFTICLMVETVAQCQVWGAEPELHIYFFPLMASVFLILTAYHKTALLARKGKRATLAFFSQCAAFFCILSFNAAQSAVYMGLFLWAVLQIFPCQPRKKEA